MNSHQFDLYRRIEAFALDDPEAAFPFSAKLAQENGWHADFNRRAIREYNRFVFLAVSAGHPVSPSKVVDQVWHLHLTYTESYWEHFCPELLGQPLHHVPSKGGPAEQAKHHAWYTKTLESYREFFGEEPPWDIWPSPDALQSAPQHEQTNHHRYGVVPKPKAPLNFGSSLVVGMVLTATGCGAVVGNRLSPFDLTGPEFLVFYFASLALAFGLAAWLRYLLRRPGSEPTAADLSLEPLEIAYLAGRHRMAIDTAVIRLLDRNVVRVGEVDGLLSVTGPLPADADPALQLAYTTIATEGTIGMRRLREQLRSRLPDAVRTLVERGLVLSEDQKGLVRWMPLMLALVVPIVGIIKIFVGISRDKPVGFLVLGSIAALVAIPFAFGRSVHRSRLGDKVLVELRRRHAEIKSALVANREERTADPRWPLPFLVRAF